LANESRKVHATTFDSGPQILVGNIRDSRPRLRIVRLAAPARTQIVVVDGGKSSAHPRHGMNAVRDWLNGDLILRIIRPKRVEHALRYRGMQLGNAVDVVGVLNGEEGHAKRFPIVLRISAAEAQESVDGNLNIRDTLGHISLQHVGGKDVKARGNRRMSGEDI